MLRMISILIFLVSLNTAATAATKCKNLLQAKRNNMSKMNEKTVIEKLGLKPLPQEGGYYKETYRSNLLVSVNQNTETKLAATAIYYMVTDTGFSALHRLKYDEVFHFYSGEAVEMLLIYPDGNHKIITLGSNIINGEVPQVVVPAGAWQGTCLKSKNGWALLGTTMAPGFDFSDFELGDRSILIQQYPKISELIVKYTRTP